MKRTQPWPRPVCRRCGAHRAPRARAGRATLGCWSLGELPQRAQQAVEGGLPGGGADVTNFGVGLLHSSWWCSCHSFRNCTRRTALSLPCVCAALPSRSAIVDDRRPQLDWLAASMNVHALHGARELLAGARFGISHAEGQRAQPARYVRCAETACSIQISLWVHERKLESCLLHSV